jgi:hypothetical protein
MIMRTFGTFLAVALLASAAGCGGDSNSSNYTSPTGRSPATGGQCPGSTSGQTCTGEQAYNDCLTKACGAQAKTCFGNNYIKGDFTGGACSGLITCLMACPCDATGDACMAQCGMTYMTDATCASCTTTLQACTTTAGCVEPVCTTTGTNTSTSTSTTGANCTALQACCATLATAEATACQAALAQAAGVDTTCASVLAGFKAASLCL